MAHRTRCLGGGVSCPGSWPRTGPDVGKAAEVSLLSYLKFRDSSRRETHLRNLIVTTTTHLSRSLRHSRPGRTPSTRRWPRSTRAARPIRRRSAVILTRHTTSHTRRPRRHSTGLSHGSVRTTIHLTHPRHRHRPHPRRPPRTRSPRRATRSRHSLQTFRCRC